MPKPTLNPLEKVQAQQEQLRRQTHTPFGPSYLMKYYYVYGWKWKDDAMVIWGPYYDKAEADGSLQKLRDGDIYESDTRDQAKATQQIKAMLLKQGGFKNRKMTVDDATRRVSHKNV